MGWTERNYDHERDERKNYQPDVPVRLEPGPLSTAMDIALIVRGMTDLKAAAELIETYTDAKAAAQRLDAVAAGARP